MFMIPERITNGPAKTMALAHLLLLLAGCASGVQINDDEAKACRTEGCSVWTEKELRGLVRKAFTEGWNAGVKHSGQGV